MQTQLTNGPYFKYPVVVVGNCSSNSLGVIRGFGRRGIPVYFVSNASEHAATPHSRYIQANIPIDRWDGEKLLKLLEKLAAQLPAVEKIVIFPTSDVSLLTYAGIKNRLPGHFVDCIPPKALVELCIYKDQFYELLSKLGISHPRTYSLNFVIQNVDRLADYLKFPLALKPVQSHVFLQLYDQKLIVAHNRADLEHYYRTVTSYGLEFLAQEIIPGEEFYLVYAYISKNHEISAVAGFRKIRQSPPDFGTGSLVECNWDERLIGEALTLLQRLHYTGIGEVEFKFDPISNKYMILEINARSITFNRLPAALGVDLEFEYYLDAIGALHSNGVLKPVDVPGRWMDFGKDLSSVFRLRRERRITYYDAIKSLKGLKVTAYFAQDDLKPFLGEVLFQSLAALKKLLREKE